jgi:hypothetical protein
LLLLEPSRRPSMNKRSSTSESSSLFHQLDICHSNKKTWVNTFSILNDVSQGKKWCESAKDSEILLITFASLSLLVDFKSLLGQPATSKAQAISTSHYQYQLGHQEKGLLHTACTRLVLVEDIASVFFWATHAAPTISVSITLPISQLWSHPFATSFYWRFRGNKTCSLINFPVTISIESIY